MRQLVLDASAAVRLVLAHPSAEASAIDALAEADTVLAPRLYFSEVANALWKYVKAGGLEEAEALERSREAGALISRSADDAELVDEALSSAVRFDHPVYDTLYAVLARRHSCPVLTMDERLKALLAEMRVEAI